MAATHLSEQSYLSNPMRDQYIYQTIPDRLRMLAHANPDKEAFVFYGLDKQRQTITRKELLEKSETLAKLLISQGLQKGSHVAFCMKSSMEMLVTSVAVICTGAVPFYTWSHLKTGKDLIDQINDAKCVMLLIDASKGDDAWVMLENIIPLTAKKSEKVPSLKQILCNGEPFDTVGSRVSLCYMMRDLETNQTYVPDIQLPRILPEDKLVYFPTSGSTGKPKAFLNSHFAILNWTKQSNKRINLNESSIYFCERPMTWNVGFPRCYFAEGCTRIFVDPHMSMSGKYIDVVCDIIEQERCDVIYLAGYLVADLLSHPHLCEKFRKVKTLFTAGERMKQPTATLIGKFCEKLYNWYGSGEAGGATMYDVGEGLEFEDGIVGQPLEGFEVKIVGEDGSVVPVNTSGDIFIRSSMRFSGYFNMADEFRATVDDDNWLLSGDIGRIRPDGNVVVEGRRKERISIMAYKVFPWDIEKVLLTCPGVDKAFAVGVPDARLHEAICACVVPKTGFTLTESDVRMFCDSHFTDDMQFGMSLKPTYHVVLDSIPMTSTGKTDRRRIGLLAKERLCL